MKNKIRQIIALAMTVALVVTMVTFAGGNTIKASNDENGNADNQTQTAEQNIEIDNPAEEPALVTQDQVEPEKKTQEIVLGEEESASAGKEQTDDSDDISKPKQILTDKASDGAIVTVTAPSGALPDGAKVTAKVINSSTVEKAIEDAVEESGKTLKSMAAYDITITDKNGKEIQPNKDVKVVISGADINGKSADVYHMDGNTPEKVASGVDADNAKFSADSFSRYVLVEVGRDSSQNVVTAYFYVQRPGKDPLSLEDEDWKYVGKGLINIENLNLEPNNSQYTLNGVAGRVLSYPSEATIKSRIALLSNVDVNDVVISYAPYKISYPMGYVDENLNSYSGNTPCYHVDMTASIKTKQKASANYFLWEAGDDGYTVVESEVLELNGTTSPKREYASEKTVNNEEYVFKGWYDNQELTGEAMTFPYTVTDSVNFYGKYVKQDKVNITYKTVGPKDSGTLSRESESLNPKAGVAEGSKATATKGYTFKGWYSDEECTNKISSEDTFTPKKNGSVWKSATYYAKFTANKAKISFVTNGGSEVADMDGLTGQTIENTSMPTTTKSGYTFIGWTDKNKNGTIITTLPDKYPAGETTYYAQWGKINATGYNDIYDGQSHGPTDVSVEGNAEGLVSKYTTIVYQVKNENDNWSDYDGVPSVKNVESLDVRVVAKATQSDNLPNLTKIINLTVTPAPVTVKAQAAEKMYGNDDPDFEATVEGTIGNDSVDYNVERPGAGTDEEVGTYAGAVKATGKVSQGNYSVSYENADFTIKTKKDLTLIAKDGGGVYNGNAYTLNDVAANKANAKIEYQIGTGEWGIEAPSATTVAQSVKGINVRASLKGHETVTVEGLKITVIPRSVTLASGNETKPYDGNPLTGNAAKIKVSEGSLVEGESFGYEMTGTQTEVGSSENTFNYLAQEGTKAGNYDITTVFGTLTVTEAEEVPVTPPNPPGGGNPGAVPLVGVVTGAADGDYDITTIEDNETPLANNLLSETCCILHLLIMLAALIAFLLYTRDMKKRQRRIFQLEKELENIGE